jgi:hypothetical protein
MLVKLHDCGECPDRDRRQAVTTEPSCPSWKRAFQRLSWGNGETAEKGHYVDYPLSHRGDEAPS